MTGHFCCMLAAMTSMTEAWAGARAARRVRPARTPILLVLVRFFASVLPSWPKVRTTVMQVAAFGFLSYAVWGWSHLLGYAAIGVSLFILEALSGDMPKRGTR
jgi:hypothetical protein